MTSVRPTPSDASPARPNTAETLRLVRAGDPDATERLLGDVYEHLRAVAGRIFRGQSASHTLQPTAVVHEAFLKLVGSESGGDWKDRAHFIAVAARAMRQILVDHARAASALKRGGDGKRITLIDVAGPDGPSAVDVLALEDALEKLATLDPRPARVAELRFLGGLNVEETALVLGVSTRTVELDWRMARGWLATALGANGPDGDAATGGRSRAS